MNRPDSSASLSPSDRSLAMNARVGVLSSPSFELAAPKFGPASSPKSNSTALSSAGLPRLPYEKPKSSPDAAAIESGDPVKPARLPSPVLSASYPNPVTAPSLGTEFANAPAV